jgi:hypothetical protein
MTNGFYLLIGTTNVFCDGVSNTLEVDFSPAIKASTPQKLGYPYDIAPSSVTAPPAIASAAGGGFILATSTSINGRKVTFTFASAPLAGPATLRSFGLLF